MKILCLFCELWLVEPLLIEGEVTYFCERCALAIKASDETNVTARLLM